MRRIDPRILIGGLLILGGLLGLLDSLNIIQDAGGIFWGLIFGALGVVFLYILVVNPTSSWWAAFPAFVLLAMSASAFLPDSLEGLSGLVFLGGIGLSFWAVYFMDRSRWWAIIPGGVLVTLGVISALDETSGLETGGFLFLGLGLTFVLVALLTAGRNNWALIPGTILLIMGGLMSSTFPGLANYIWPAALILVGGYLVWNFFRVKS